MLVGTAGHIDHGKTTLVKALTGVDTDRLPEEKKRGISIELGFAFLDVPGLEERIGFIDVPGHERLVHTMLAGATGIDFALLLVAADDGVMPQTREHLAVISLLGIARGAVAITKTDRADDARLHEVRAEVTALLRGTSLDGAPVLPVSAPRGEGMPELKSLLIDAARATEARSSPEHAFRLAIDRVFTLPGVGTVVTGTVHAGTAAPGDQLALVPDGSGTTVRVRSVHAQNRAVDRARAGQRCALALAGVARERMARGQWLVAPAVALSAQRIDARITLWQGETAALRSGTAVHVHIGAAATLGSATVLDAEGVLRGLLAPGETGRVQLVARAPMGAWHGDRVVLRDASASRTIAGGRVLDPFGPLRYRRTPQRLSELDALAAPEPRDRLLALLAVAPQGVDLRRFAAAQGLPVAAPLADALPAGTLHQGDEHSESVLGNRQSAVARADVLAALSAFHEQQRDQLGPDAARLRRLSCPRLTEALWRALLAALQAEGVIAVRGAFVHLPSHGVRLSAIDQRIQQKLVPRLAAAGFEGAWARDLARDCGEPEPLMRGTLARLAQRGDVHQVVKDLYYPRTTMARLVAITRATASARGGGEVTAAAFRDGTGLGRKRAIQLLEYLDRVGLLRRVGDAHRLRGDSPLFMDTQP